MSTHERQGEGGMVPPTPPRASLGLTTQGVVKFEQKCLSTTTTTSKPSQREVLARPVGTNYLRGRKPDRAVQRPIKDKNKPKLGALFCLACLQVGKTVNAKSCHNPKHKRDAGVSVHRPKSAANGIRIGEASNPGPKGKARKGGKKKQSPSLPPVPDILSDSDDEEEPDKRPTITVVMEVGTNYSIGYGLNGLVASRGNKRYFDSKGNLTYTVDESELTRELIGYRERYPGFYEPIDDLEQVVQTRLPFERHTTRKMKIGSQTFPATDRVVHVQLLKELRVKFANPLVTPQTLRAFTGFAQKAHPTLPVVISAHTVQLFCIETHVNQEAVRSKQVNAVAENSQAGKGIRSFFQPEGLQHVSTFDELGLATLCGSFHRKYGEEDTKEQDRTDNGNFRIVASRGYTPFAEGAVAGEFKTPDNESPKLYYTQPFAVLPRGTDFRLLDKSGRNVAKAMSRLHKARENEAALQLHQAQLLDHMELDPVLLADVSNDPERSRAMVEDLSLEHDERAESVKAAVASFFSAPPSARWYDYMAGWVTLPLFLMCGFVAVAFYVGLYARAFLGARGILFKFRQFPKKALYQRWFGALTAEAHAFNDPINDEVEAKFKTEMAKPGKHGRLFVTYARSILQAGWIYEKLKDVFCTTHNLTDLIRDTLPAPVKRHLDDVNIHVKKSLEEGAKFEELAEPQGLNVNIFSDDMSCIYNKDGVSIYFDADISSCDAGNGFAMFYLLGLVMRTYGFGQYIHNQFRRLRAAITVRNPSAPKEFVKLKPRSIFQGSGCPETTLVNDVASFCIAISIAVHIAFSNYEHAGTPESFDQGDAKTRAAILTRAAYMVGHKITVDFRDDPAKLQFLKYSQLETTCGRRVNTRNVGALLRNLGRLPGDLTAVQIGVSRAEFRKMEPADKYERYVSGVVAGLCNEPSHIITDALRQRFPRRSGPVVSESHASKLDDTDRSHYTIPLHGLQARYGGEDWEWEGLANAIENMEYGRIEHNSLLTSIFGTDYSL